MRFKLIIVLFLCLNQIGDSQIFSIRPGQMIYRSKTITPVIGQRKQIEFEDYFSLHFDHFSLNKKLQLGLSYSSYRGKTGFSVKTDFWGGNGGGATTLHRFALEGGYNIAHHSNRLKFSPQVKLIFEKAVATWGKGEIGYIDSRVDDHFEGPLILAPLNSFQVLPALGFDLDWNFWWRLHLVYSTYYAWGHKPFQKYYFEYTYDGVPQPTGEWHSDGTGWFFSVGMGMTIFQYKKEKAERALRRKRRRN